MRYISFSLWGRRPEYCDGAVENAALAKTIFPGWQLVFFVDETVPVDVLEALRDGGCRIEFKPEAPNVAGAFWRFEAIEFPDADLVIFRDADSYFTHRERAAVCAWEESGRAFHIMRDHPQHLRPIMAGMWGCRPRLLGGIAEQIRNWKPRARYQDDQDMLEVVVYPHAVRHALIHSEYVQFAGERVERFPVPRSGGEFVGGSRRRPESLNYASCITQSPTEPRLLPSPLRLRRRVFLALKRARHSWVPQQ